MELLKNYKTNKKKKFLVVLTGGYSKMFKKSINYKTVINQNITPWISGNSERK